MRMCPPCSCHGIACRQIDEIGSLLPLFKSDPRCVTHLFYVDTRDCGTNRLVVGSKEVRCYYRQRLPDRLDVLEGVAAGVAVVDGAAEGWAEEGLERGVRRIAEGAGDGVEVGIDERAAAGL